MKRRFTHSRRRRAGFTLIEVLLVLVILVVLGSFVGFQLQNARKRSQLDTARAQIGQFTTPIETFSLHIGRYPNALEDLIVAPSDLADPTKWGPEPYLNKDKIPLDPWDNAYKYEAPAEGTSRYRIWSAGPDGIDGNDDDISNQD